MILSPRERAWQAFQRSEGAFLEREPVQSRRVRARAAQPPKQRPVPPPPGPRPTARQITRRQLIIDRVDQQFRAASQRYDLPKVDGVGDGSLGGILERFAGEFILLGLARNVGSDLAADLEDTVERQAAALAAAQRTIDDLTARLIRLEKIEADDSRAARAIAALKASRS